MIELSLVARTARLIDELSLMADYAADEELGEPDSESLFFLRAIGTLRSVTGRLEAAEKMALALQVLLPGLELDLRYADSDDDLDAMRSRIKTVRDALAPVHP